jgi:hypothetical protein
VGYYQGQSLPLVDSATGITSQAAPLVGTAAHPPDGLQESSVHGSPSLQTTAVGLHAAGSVFSGSQVSTVMAVMRSKPAV